MVAEIPVWVGGLQKWVTGLSKKTTCEDIVKALLKAEGRPLVEEKEWHHYVVVERWRKVERPLDPKAKILKVWKAWGEEQSNVKLTLRRLQPLTPKEVKNTRKRPSSKLWRHGSATTMSSRMNTVHPRKLMQQRTQNHKDVDMDGHITETMERLMKVIIAQGETIQAQLQHLRDREDQIDFFEQQRHAVRVEELGANYLLDTYLGKSSSAGNKSSAQRSETEPSIAAAPCESTGEACGAVHLPQEAAACGEPRDIDDMVHDLQQCSGYYERFLVLSERLEREEEMALWLTSQIQEHHDVGHSSDATAINKSSMEEVQSEIHLMRERVECLTVQNVANDAEIRECEIALVDVESVLDDKRCYVIHLERDLAAVEKESSKLQMELQRFCCDDDDDVDVGASSPIPVLSANTTSSSSSAICDKDPIGNDTDSNSDTGLSSLHSSSDEGVSCVLDTLV